MAMQKCTLRIFISKESPISNATLPIVTKVWLVPIHLHITQFVRNIRKLKFLNSKDYLNKVIEKQKYQKYKNAKMEKYKITIRHWTAIEEYRTKVIN